MEKMELDILLKQSLTPDSQPEECLKQTILERMETEDVSEKIRSLETSKKWRKRSMLPKVAAVVLAILVVGAGSTYAAGRIKQAKVVEHGIILEGDADWVQAIYKDYETPEDFYESLTIPKEINPDEYEEEIIWETPGPDDHWINKETRTTIWSEGNGQKSTTYTYAYSKYAQAAADWNYLNLFGKLPADLTEESIRYCHSDVGADEEAETARICNLISVFKYHERTVNVTQSVYRSMDKDTDEIKGSDIIEYFYVREKGKVYSYVAKNGTEYTLVEDLAEDKETLVAFIAEDEYILIRFFDFTEEEMHQFLDLLYI